MEIVKALFDAGDATRIICYDANGDSVVKQYPPITPVDKALIKKLGGHDKILEATTKFNDELIIELYTYEKFKEGRANFTNSYAIDSILVSNLSKEDLMKLKLSIFDHDLVKNSKNREILTNIRKAEDPIDLIMYFGMLRKEANVENKE